MASRIGYRSPYEWAFALLRPLRVPLVFLLSGLGSFCAFQDGNAPLGGSAGAAGNLTTAALWDADLMPAGDRLAVREAMSGNFAKTVSPELLVVYDVPRFDQLLKLRDALGLYGYTAVMSNFFCGKAPVGAQWPFEIAVLSRYPISEAVQYEAPGKAAEACSEGAPLTSGPAIAKRASLNSITRSEWPAAADGRHLAGPGLLGVRIDSVNTSVIAIRVPAASEYQGADPAALARMRGALATAAHQWMVIEHKNDPDHNVLAMGDFGFGPGGHAVRSADAGAMAAVDGGDSVDRLMLNAVSDPSGRHAGAASLTHHLFAEGLSPGVFPHSDRVYALQSGPMTFGPASRTAESYGSRAFPLIVRNSGATCALEPAMRLQRRSPIVHGLSHQFFAAADLAFDRQLSAYRRQHRSGWIVSIDLDDVLLDDSPLLYGLALQCRQPSNADWRDWVASDKVELTAGAHLFIQNLRARAAADRGRIVLTTRISPDLRNVMVSQLVRLGLMAGANDPVVQLAFAADPAAREARWRQVTAGGARLLLVLGGNADQFPNDPRIPVGGSDRSCRNERLDQAGRLQVFGSQPARFGVCYYLLPGAVL